MNQTMRWQSSTPKPYETFAADMLRHVAAKYIAPECADLKTKVVVCETHDDWGELWSLAKQALNPDRLSTEYKEPGIYQTNDVPLRIWHNPADNVALYGRDRRSLHEFE